MTTPPPDTAERIHVYRSRANPGGANVDVEGSQGSPARRTDLPQAEVGDRR